MIVCKVFVWKLPADVARGRELSSVRNSCCQNLEAVAVEQLEEPPGCIVYHPLGCRLHGCYTNSNMVAKRMRVQNIKKIVT